MRSTVAFVSRRQVASLKANPIRCALLVAALAAGSCADDGAGSPSDVLGDGGGTITTGAGADATPSGATASGPDSGGAPTGDQGSRGGVLDAGPRGAGGTLGGTRGGTGGADAGTVQDSGAANGSARGNDGGAAQPSSGCGSAPAAAGEATMQVDGMDRQYVVALPSGYEQNRPYPLVLAFHGAGLSGPQFRSFFNLTTPVGADGIVVYPTGLGGQWDVRRDYPFVDALIIKLASSYCVDTGRVFATGHSNGAFFTNALGCQRGDVLRAIAPMSGGQQQRASSCKGEVAVWISHGDVDNIVATSYGQQARDFWVMRNQCNAMTSAPVMPSPCVEYAGCTSGFPVRYCEYSGDHNLMRNAAQTIWDFFKQL